MESDGQEKIINIFLLSEPWMILNICVTLLNKIDSQEE